MKRIAFTICAKNYLGLALTLEKSIKANNEGIDFFVFVADELSEELLLELPRNVLVAKDTLHIEEAIWYHMAFKYDLTEFCTSIKPSCFKYLFDTFNPNYCVYFDPDILVFGNLDGVFKELESYSIIVTPHIVSIQDHYTGALPEQSLLFSGMFNLGFLALKNDEIGDMLLSWWSIRLKDKCYQDKTESLFTDQKWMDFLPSLFPTQLLISTDLGLNLAPWNFHERQVVKVGSSYFVKSRIRTGDFNRYKLTFVHFSGFNYRLLLSDTFDQENIKDFSIHKDIVCLLEEYGTYLKQSEVLAFIDLKYSYNFFSNGNQISKVYRKLFRRLLDDGRINANPFEANGQFYLSLKNSGILMNKMQQSDKVSVSNVNKLETKTILINKFFFFVFKVCGSRRFFLLVRLLRLYSKMENHIYLIDKSYFRKFKIWS